MPYQPGAATSAAMMTGEPITIAVAMTADLAMMKQAADAKNEAAEKQRNDMVLSASYEQREHNQVLAHEQEQNANALFDEQVQAVKALGRAENVDNGIVSSTEDRVMSELKGELGRTYSNYKRTKKAVIAQEKTRSLISKDRLGGRIKLIELAKPDYAGFITGTAISGFEAYQNGAFDKKSTEGNTPSPSKPKGSGTNSA